MIFKAFEKIAKHNLDRTALVCNGNKFSYGECLNKVDSLESVLSGFKNEAVLVIANKSEYSVLWQLAINKTNNVFCMVDAKTPIERFNKIIKQLKPRLIISDKKLDTLDVPCSQVNEGGFFIYNNKDFVSYSDDVSHIYFSSGSTGNPKGILLRAEPVIDVVRQQALHTNLVVGSRFAWLLNVGFDASLSDIYSTLLSGAELHVCTFEQTKLKTLSNYFNENSITHSDLSPSVLSLLKDVEFKTLQYLVIGGEVGNEKIIKDLARKYVVFNAYGPTETSICSSMRRVTDTWTANNIGAPLDGVEYRIDDGELLIGGENVAIGYLDKDLTEAKFFSLDGRRYYRTGDLVKKENKDFYFLGRKDRQFKYNGVLISPEEIERSALESGCENALCKKEDKIVLYYVGNADIISLRENLKLKLNANMLPHVLVKKDELELNINNKIKL